MLRGQAAYWREAGFEMEVVSGPGPDLELFGREEGVRVHAVEMRREIAPWRDLHSLWALWGLMRRLRPTVVEAGTPKAGLLGGIAGWLAGIPARVYILHGLRLETLGGWMRRLALLGERAAAAAAHEVIAVSPSLLQAARACGALGLARGVVAGPGTANGVDVGRYSTAPPRQGPPVLGFVGRFTRDKGFATLLEAFDLLRREFPKLRLLLVGSFEDGDAVAWPIRERVANDPAIEWTGFVDDATPYYERMNVVALPSRREGFPICALEAAAAARPLVAARATGSVDAVIDGETGLLVAPDSPEELAAAVGSLLRDPSKARAMGSAALRRVTAQYRPPVVWAAKESVYRRLLDDAIARRLPAQRIVKRALDIALASCGLAVAAPLLVALAPAVRLRIGAPVLFRQQRAGLRGRPFTLYKLRTMTDARDQNGALLPDDRRLTPLGAWLRRWSLDELPQLWNVLRGEMSLVGPRPLLADYQSRYSRRQRRRGLVKPGMTGWAQVSGRNGLDWERRLELDARYAERWNLALDLRILGRTLIVVAKGRGVTAGGGVTPREFQGVKT